MGVMRNTLPYKQVASFPVQVLCVCSVFVKMLSKELPKMSTTNVYRISGLISTFFFFLLTNILIKKLNKMLTIKIIS